MRFSILSFALLLTVAPVFGQDQSDCKIDNHVLGNFGLDPFVIIRIKLPLPYRISSGKYFDAVVVRSSNGRASIKRFIGNRLVDQQDGIPTDSAEDAIKKYCPETPIFDQIAQATGSQARAAIVPPPAGGSSREVVFADLDGDGAEDTAFVDGTVLTVDLRNANGTIRATQTYAAPQDSEYVIAADFNGDNRPELVASSKVTNPASGGAFFYLNNGNGSFQSGQPVDAGNSTIKAGPMAAGDVNGDGKMDLLYSSPTGFRRMLGNGSGGFQGSDGQAMAIQPYSLVTADFNGDGRLDVVALDRFTNTLALRYGTGSGSFQTAISSQAAAVVGDLRGVLSYSDFNHDGQLDLVIRYGNHHMFSLLLGNPGGTFQAPKNYVAPGDNSSLAILPLASSQLLVMLMDRITQDMVVYIAPGNGTILAPAMGKLNDSITAIGSGDFDGDADQDLLFGMANNQIVLQRNAGGGVLQAQAPVTLSGRPTGAVTADLNGDGRADGIFTLRSGNAAVLLGNANGTFGTATPFAAGSSPSHPQLADFNKDGKPDLAVIPELFGGGAGQASVLLGNGQGGFGSPVTLATNAGDLTGLTTGDFNGDQNPDIVVTTATGGGNGTGNIAFFRGNGNGTFQNAVTTPLVSSYALAGGDFDRDGKLDLAIVLNSNTIQIVLGNGNGTWRSGSTIAVLTTGTDLQALDLNRDGNPDLINDACCGEVRTTYLVGYGNGTFGPEEAIEAPNSPAPIAMADLNGDAWLDIALGGNGGFYTVQQMRFPALLVVNSASGRFGVAPDSIASGYGSWPTMQANPVGSTVTVKDSAGVTRDSFIYYSSPSLVNFTIPAGTALGESTVTVHAGGGVTSSTKVAITNVAPALYMINGDRLVAARVIRVSGGTTSREEVFQLVNGAIVTKPVSLGPATDEVFLELYGTGLRAAGKAGTIVTIGGVVVPIEYAGAQGAPGFDQVNVKLPRSLVGKGAVELILTAGDKKANTVTLTIQ